MKRFVVLFAVGLGAGCATGGAPQLAAPTPKVESPEIVRFRAKLEKDPMLWPVWGELGGALLFRFRESGNVADLEEAKAALLRSLEIQENEEARRWLAAVYLDEHRFEQATIEAAKALEMWPEDGIARAILTDSLMARGRYDEAEKKLREFPEEDRDFYTIVGLSRVRFAMGAPDEAIALLNEAKSKLEPAETGPYANARAWCALMIGSYSLELDRKDEALASLEEALRIRPTWLEALEHRAEWEATYGDKEAAVRMYEQILSQHTRPQELVALGELLLEMGRKKEGMTNIQRAEAMLRERLRQGDVSVHRELLMILVDHLGRFDEAVELAERDLEIRQDFLAYDSLAWAALHKGDLKRAQDAIRSATQYGTPLRELQEHRRQIEIASSRAHP